jgi:hypothetical protein
MGELNLACRSRVEVTKALTHAGEAAGKRTRMRMLGICRINKLLFHQGLVKIRWFCYSIGLSVRWLSAVQNELGACRSPRAIYS